MTERIASERVLVFLAGLILLPLAAYAQTTNITRPIGADQMDLMSVPLIVPGGNTVSNVFKNAPAESQFYFWDTNLGWTVSWGSAKGWGGIGSRQVLPGEAFFFKPPGAYTVVLSGTPPEPPITIPVSGYEHPSLLGYPYPVEIHWTDTQLATLLPPGSMVSFWNRTNASFRTTFLKAPAAKGGGWGNAASNYIVRAGDGFAVKQSGAPFNWTE
jgi:hypothetical protein